MTDPRRQLDWIDAQAGRMTDLVRRWAGINSGSDNLPGLQRMLEELEAAFGVLGGRMERLEAAPRRVVEGDGRPVDRPVGRMLRIVKRPEAPRRVFLGIHMDTVYGPDHPFQRVEPIIGGHRLRGPGVADAKGGLAVMLLALETLERSEAAGRLGWEILINSDEEVGSTSSAPLLRDAARRNHLGLVFEPTLEDGALIAHRKGSGNFSVVVRGRSAHVGRHYERGRSAIAAIARLITDLEALGAPGSSPAAGLTVNVGRVEGGGAVNVVPALAICHFNIRYEHKEQAVQLKKRIDDLVRELSGREGITAELHGGFTAPPKPLDGPTERLMEHIAGCGRELGLEIGWKGSGGVCDGNRLAAAGLVNIDTMGVRGGGIHSPDEFIILDSLPERAKLSALLLMKLARGEIDPPATPNARL